MIDKLSVRVINLDRSADRLDTIHQQLSAADTVFTRFAARDMRTANANDVNTYDDAHANRLYGRPLTMAEIGCYLSHLGCLQDFVASDDEWLLVLEDDAVVPPDLLDWCGPTLEALDKVRGGAWHCVNLSQAYRKRRRFLVDVGKFRLFRAFYFPTLTSALLWSREGAIAFLNAPEGRKIYGPIDNQIRTHLCRTGGGISTDVPPIPQSDAQSVIGNAGRADASVRFGLAYSRRKYPNYLWAIYNQLTSR